LKEVDVAVLLIYMLGVVVFGSWFVRRSRTTERFMAAGRSLPGWAVGLSIFAAAMSSIDTSLNSSATIVLADVYRRYVRPSAGERESMAVLYATTLLFGAAVTGAICGILVTAGIVWLIMVPESWGWPRSPLHEFLIPVIGTATIVTLGLLVSRFTGSRLPRTPGVR